jgi:hypothetical protein
MFIAQTARKDVFAPEERNLFSAGPLFRSFGAAILLSILGSINIWSLRDDKQTD